jgi:hypothetical protein
MKDVPIASVVTVFDDPRTGTAIFLVIHEALYFGTAIKQTLLCANQMQANGLDVHDVPRQFDQESLHSVVIPQHDLTIPLSMEGVISYLPTRKPTQEEMTEFRALDSTSWIELTSDVAWEPYSDSFRTLEEQLAAEARMAAPVSRTLTRVRDGDAILSQTISLARQAWNTPPLLNLNDEQCLADRLVSMVNVASDDVKDDGLGGRWDDEVYPLDPEA